MSIKKERKKGKFHGQNFLPDTVETWSDLQIFPIGSESEADYNIYGPQIMACTPIVILIQFSLCIYITPKISMPKGITSPE